MDYRQIFFLLASVLWLIGHFKMAEAANYEPAERRELTSENISGVIIIDCGADKDYFDQSSGLNFKSDADFVSTGENHNISPENYFEDPHIGRSLNSLRSFPNGIRNCYTLKFDRPKNRYYFIRAFFKYGNYDGTNTFPSFNLYLGVNFWKRVVINSPSETITSESTHFILNDTIDICLVNTGKGTPFISTLELRPLLNNSVYKVGSQSLTPQTDHECDLGSSEHYVMPEKDLYGRFWVSCYLPGSVSINTSAVNFGGSNDSYEVPMKVLRTAAQAAEGGDNLLSYTYTNNYTGTTADYYFYFHFAEISKIEQAGKQRQVVINLNGVKYGPITLEYLKPFTVRSDRVSIRYLESATFSIHSTDPDLPPILNAFEIYEIYPSLTSSPTEAAEVDAILEIKRTYKVDRDDWQGDPCLPIDFKWNGLSCSDGNGSKRIISLNLSSSNLAGEIAFSFSKLKAIQFLDLSYNNLNGTVPEFLAQLPNLTVLNLTGNNFIGSIPQSLLEKAKNGMLQLSLHNVSMGENPSKCNKESCEKKKHGFVLPIIASVISISILLLLSAIAIFWRMKKRDYRAVAESEKNSSFKSKNRCFSYSEIIGATSNFSNIIGEGGFGKVYLGNLKDGTQVAVKLLSQSSKQGYKEFQSEVQLLMVVYHRNLVSLIGYCDESDNMALVYEYMENGNLRHHLSGGSNLSWIKRLQIAIDAAQGLEYLHNGCKPPIIHRDLKTANILLDKNLLAKISDFGLSRVFATEKDTHVITSPAGTFGYVDPEFYASGHLNKKSDVYSFGVILFELITGLPVVIKGHESSTHILQWVGPTIESGDITGVIDQKLQGEFSANSSWKAVEIAMSCVSPTRIQRPDMNHVLTELKECLAMEMESEKPARIQNNITASTNSLEMSLPSAR